MQIVTKGLSKALIIDSFEDTLGFHCPECGVWYSPNGTGPSNLPFAAKLLKRVPSEILAGGLPAFIHDIAYLLCPAGWVIEFSYIGKIYRIKDKKSADKTYRALIIARAKKHYRLGFIRALAWSIAWRNFFFVDMFGQKSFKHEHTEEMKKQESFRKFGVSAAEKCKLNESPPI